MVTLANLQGGSLVPEVGSSLNLLLDTFGTKQQRDERDRLRGLEEKKSQDISDALSFATSGDPSREEEGLALIASIQGPAVANSIRATLDRGDQAQIATNKQKNDESLKDVLFLQDIKDPAKRANAITQLGSRPGMDAGDLNELIKLQNMEPDIQDLELERDRLSLTALDDILKERVAKQKFAQELQKQAQAPVTLSPGQQRFGAGGIPGVSLPATPKDTRTSLEKNLALANIDPQSPQGQKIIIDSLTKPATQIDINKGFKVPTGFQRDPNDSSQVIPISGGPKDNLKGENAAKIQGLRSAMRSFKGDPGNEIPSVRDLVFDEDGSLDRTNLFNAQFGTIGTQGRLLKAKMEQGIQAITRSETGAAMPPEELENTRTRFMPNAGDSTEIAKLKLDMFEDWVGGALKLIDPNGRFDADRFQSEVAKRAKKKGIKESADFSQISDEELLKNF